jgi:hypothetical protein
MQGLFGEEYVRSLFDRCYDAFDFLRVKNALVLDFSRFLLSVVLLRLIRPRRSSSSASS